MGKKMTFRRPDGKEGMGYYSAPAQGEDAPGIVVIQEWWGVSDQIKGVADRLAQEGYRALVPDLYKGKVTLEAAEAEHLMSNLDFKDAAAQDIRGAVQHLKTSGSAKVGVIGFCMGGVLTILAAALVKEADAAVPWYGIPPEGAVDPSTITIPVQGHFADRDEHFPPAQVDALESAFQKGNVPYEIYRYDANHAFGNESGVNYDPECAKLAWERSLAFLKKHVR